MIIPPDSRTTNLMIWAILFGALALWQVISVLHPRLISLGGFFGLLERWWITRWALLAGWFWLGWHVWVRGGW